MKNHYVMNDNHQMLHRDTLEGCVQWCRAQARQWRSMGMQPPRMRVFYDSATEPTLAVEWISDRSN